ncbi:MAG: hypothetical protein J5I50_13205 [Chitinophagaceae bacterium]|nr:hypothetical protein [Chitinophagaceae bacterium]
MPVIIGSLIVPFTIILVTLLVSFWYNKSGGTGNEAQKDAWYNAQTTLVMLWPVITIIYGIVFWRIDKRYMNQLKVNHEAGNPKQEKTPVPSEPASANLPDENPENHAPVIQNENGVYSYVYRKSLFEKMTTWVLKDDALCFSGEDTTEICIPYKHIRQLQLFYFPNRYKTNNYACKIVHNNGTDSFYSVTFKGVGNFADNRIMYTPFVTTLVKTLSRKNPAAEIIAGNTTGKYIVNWIIIGAAILLLLGSLLFFPLIGGGFLLLLRLAFIAYLLFYGLKHMKANVPRKVINGNIPPEVIPALSNL